VKAKNTCFTPKTGQLRKMADCTIQCGRHRVQRGFGLETRSSASDHDDLEGGRSLSVGTMRISAAERQRAGATCSPNLTPFKAREVACANDTLNRRQKRSFADVDMWESASCLKRIYSKSPSVFGTVNLEHASRPILSQRRGA
jgi:hypothetical protein